MTRRGYLRLIFILVLLGALGARELIAEHHSSWLRPGQHMYAYVANRADGTLSVLDLVRLAPIATIAVGPEPSSMKVRPGTREIWGVSGPGGFVWAVDGVTGRTIAKIQTGPQPSSLEFSADGLAAYVAVSGANQLAKIDAATRTITQRIAVGRLPTDVSATRDGKLLLVANGGDATLSVLDARTLATRATIPVVPHPQKIAVLPDDSKAFVLSDSDPLLSVVNLNSESLVADLSLGGRATDLILKPDGGELYLPSPGAHGLVFVNTTTNEVSDFMVLGLGPQSATPIPDGRLIVTDAAAGRIIPVVADDRLAQPSALVGEGPVAAGFTPGGEILLVVNKDSRDIAVLRTVDLKMITLIPTGRDPDSIAVLLF